jgi:hypothetical protein
MALDLSVNAWTMSDSNGLDRREFISSSARAGPGRLLAASVPADAGTLADAGARGWIARRPEKPANTYRRARSSTHSA